MKLRTVLLSIIVLINSSLYAQLLHDDFESYELSPRINLRWKAGKHIELDTSYVRSGRQALRIDKESSLIYKTPVERLGRLSFSMLTQGPGVWNVVVSVSRSLDFDDNRAWERIETFATNPSLVNYSARTAEINRLEQHFVRLSFEPIGLTTPLYLDDIHLAEISPEAENILREALREERLRQQRKADFDQLILSASYSDAKRVAASYEQLYRSRVKSLAMLYDKSNMIKIVSGTAATLGDFNQLGNPTRYEKYRQLQATLFPKLEAIDTLFYADQVKGRLETFFKKIENPLNIAIGIGDVFTGGAISKVVDSFKGLITKGYSTQRLESLGLKSKALELERHKGIRLYLDAKEFFEDIEAQNERSLLLNKKIAEVFNESKNLNDEVMKLFIDYLAFAKIEADNNRIIELAKNQDYKTLDRPIADYFAQELGDAKSFNKDRLSNRLKDIDQHLQRIDQQIAAYNRLSNQLSSFYADFKKETERPCPYRNVSATDRQTWDSNVLRLQTTIGEVESAFNRSYLEVNFKQ